MHVKKCKAVLSNQNEKKYQKVIDNSYRLEYTNGDKKKETVDSRIYFRKKGRMMPLTMSPKGEEIKIQKIGGKDEVRRHLEELGFVAGGFVTVVSEVSGNMIVNVKGSRIAIGRELATHIFV
jgi:ferrous iron transport protein A